MNAKEKQLTFIKSYLKPTFKRYGYLTRGRTWWRDQGDFLHIIDLQNFSWNTKDDVTFCLNIGIALKASVKDLAKPVHYDRIVGLRQASYLPEERITHVYLNKAGYVLTNQTNLEAFIVEFKKDFEEHIIPNLEQLRTLKDCIDFYGELPFWGKRLIDAVGAI